MNTRIPAGIFNINKPSNITSMEVVRRVKRSSGIKKVGHGGTLDPLATGVIPIFLGPATRMMEYVLDTSKVYRATIEFGVTTDTYDSTGKVTEKSDCSGLSRSEIVSALKQFHGEITQIPPMYSALKLNGKRLYELARKGVHVDRKPRPVKVYYSELGQWNPPYANIKIHCGRGFYMRSLAHDLGQIVGCGAHLKSLERLKVGPFILKEASSIEKVERSFSEGTWTNLVHSPDITVANFRVIIVGESLQKLIENGRPIPQAFSIPPIKLGELCRVYGTSGQFLAIMRFDSNLTSWKAEKVFVNA